MEVFINDSTAQAVIVGLSGLTGNLFTSLLLIVFLLIVVCIVLRIQIEWIAIFLLPLLLTLWAYDASFIALGGTFLIYLGLVLAKNFFIRT